MTDDDGYSTRDAAEVRGRIADILGYCNLDGRLHDPGNFEKKFLRSQWVCPDCSTVAGKVAFKRAQELQWILVPPQGSDSSTQPTEEEVEEAQSDAETESDQESDDEDETAGATGDTDSEDVKARIENAQADIEEIEETAER